MAVCCDEKRVRTGCRNRINLIVVIKPIGRLPAFKPSSTTVPFFYKQSENKISCSLRIFV